MNIYELKGKQIPDGSRFLHESLYGRQNTKQQCPVTREGGTGEGHRVGLHFARARVFKCLTLWSLVNKGLLFENCTIQVTTVSHLQVSPRTRKGG